MPVSPQPREGQAAPRSLGGDYIDPRDLTASSPLRDLARAYLQELQDKGRSAGTLPRYAGYLEEFMQFVERAAGPARISDIDLRTLKAYGSHLTRLRLRAGREPGSRPISAATKNLHLIALRGLLRFAVLLDLPVPPPEKVELARAAQPSPDARHLETSRLERLLEAADPTAAAGLRVRALLEVLLATGCRISELLGLDRADVELDPAAPDPVDGIRVLDEVTVLGKGNRYRKVFLTRRAREWLALYLRSRKDRDPALFVTDRRSRDGSYRMSIWTAQRIIGDTAKRAGLAEDVSPHWLRHAAITTWATQINILAAQRLAGHRHISSTNRYLGSSDAELKQLYKQRIG